MALQTLPGSKMLIVAGIMTICAGRNNTLFPGRMCCMTFRAGKILKMGAAIVCKVLHGFFMAGRTESGINGRFPFISGGLMGLMTKEAIL